MKLETFNWHIKQLKPGEKKVFSNARLDNETYHAGSAYGSSVFKDVHQKTAKYVYHKHIKKDLPFEQTPTLLLGSVFHKLVLEPKLFNFEFVRAEDAPKKPTTTQRTAAEKGAEAAKLVNEYDSLVVKHGEEYEALPKKPTAAQRKTASTVEAVKSYDNWVAKNHGLTIVSDDTYQQAALMRDAVKAHPLAKQLLKGGKAEQSVIWIDERTGLKMKCRADYLTANNVVIDLKSCNSISDEEISRSVAKFNYEIQEAHYKEAFNADGFVFIFVTKGDLPEVKVVTLGEAFDGIGAHRWKTSTQRFADLKTEYGRKLWHDDSETEVVEIDAPAWEVRKFENGLEG